MRMLRRALLYLACAAVVVVVGPAPAQGAAPEPDQVIFAIIDEGPDFYDPCGIAVSSGELYVSSYYRHAIDAFVPGGPFAVLRTRLANVDPQGGPCGLSLDGAGHLYVNNYHRNVQRFTLADGLFAAPTTIDSSHPTGVAANPLTNDVYVNARTHLTAYDSTGAPLMDGPDPLKIGVGSLGDGYGLAVSSFSATLGRIYVPDHATDTVKVYDPLIDKDDPVQIITGPPGGFGSLRDSAVAVDVSGGDIYVADSRAYPQYTERPETTIYIFAATGAYKGRLKYNVIDSNPVGLAAAGRVYVTSGNSTGAAVYAYPPGSATTQSAPPSAPLSMASAAAEQPAKATAAATVPATGGSASAERGKGATASVIAQKGNLRVAVSGKMTPKRLPRDKAAPISVSVGGEISTTDATLPPQLDSIRIELNKEGQLDATGLPTCAYDRIQPGSSSRALSACHSALVGEGSFTANITLAGQDPYPTSGKLLVFNATEKGKPVLYGHIYAPKPFATSFVIVFKIQKLGKGTYGTSLNAPMPAAMDAWGRLTGLQMTLDRRYSYKGKQRSFISAGCPAPKGFPGATFPLARTEFAFQDGKKLGSVLSSDCRVRG